MRIQGIVPAFALTGVVGVAGCGGGGGGGSLQPDSEYNIIMLQSALFRERDGEPFVHEVDFPTSGSVAYGGYANFGIGESGSNNISYAGEVDLTVHFDGTGDVSGRIHNIHAGGFVITGGRTGYVGPVDGELTIGNGTVQYGQPHPALYPDIVADVDGTLRHPDTTGRFPEVVRHVEGTFQGNFTGEDMQYLHGNFSNRDPRPFGAAFGGSIDAERHD